MTPTEVSRRDHSTLLRFSGTRTGSDVEKARTFLREILSMERKTVISVVVYGVGVGVFSLAIPIAAQNLVNAVMLGNLLQPLVFLTLAVAVLLGAAGAMRVLQRIAAEYVQNRIFAKMSIRLSQTLPRVATEELERVDGAELTNRFFEVMTIQKAGAIILVDGLAVALQLSIGILLLAVYHPYFLAFDVLLILAVWLTVKLPSNAAADTSILESKKKYRVIAWLEELLRNPVLSKDPVARRFALQRTDEYTLDYLEGRKLHFRILMRQLITIVTIQALGSAALLGVGGLLVIRGQLTLGQLVAAELVLTMALTALTKLSKVLEAYYDLLASSDKLNQLITLPQERSGESDFGKGDPRTGMAIEWKTVRYRFPRSEITSPPVSFDISPGEKFALLGPNGSGKTTLAEMLYGLRQPSSGSVLVDGKDLRTCDLDTYRNEVVLVRDIELYAGSILDNLTLGNAAIPLDAVHATLDRLGLLHEILALPDALATSLSGTFLPLSTGQLHRLMLARALLRKPRLLICDELLDLVDVRSRDHLQRALFDWQNDFTLLITTHDRALTERCDRSIDLALLREQKKEN